MSDLQEIQSLVASDDLDEALRRVTELIAASPDDSELYFTRGKIYWRLGRRPKATGDYARAVALDPDSPARHALEQASEIAGFFNPDLYNP